MFFQLDKRIFADRIRRTLFSLMTAFRAGVLAEASAAMETTAME
ncbi:hypothetical protein [Roseibium suaedae]|nr:hypothetical protein [Roseibium suaedae]